MTHADFAIEHDAQATALAIRNYAALHLLKLHPEEGTKHIGASLEHLFATVPDLVRVEPVSRFLVELDEFNQGAINLCRLLFAQLTDNVYSQHTGASNEENRALALRRHADEARYIFGMLPRDAKLENRVRHSIRNTTRTPGAYGPLIEFLFARIALHWAHEPKASEAKRSMDFFVKQLKIGSDQIIADQALAALRNIDTSAPPTRIAEAIVQDASKLRDFSRNRTTLVKNLAQALVKVAEPAQLVAMARPLITK